MDIVCCGDEHREAWNRFVARCPHASFYHRYEWRQVNERCLGHPSCYLAAMEEGQVCGVFPLVHIKSRLFGDVACSLPFVNYGGPVGETENVEALLLDEAADVIDEWGVDFLEIRSRRSLGLQFPTSEHKVSMTVGLEAGVDAIWRAFTTAHRKDIRHGYKNGFTARTGGAELVAVFYDVLAEAWRDRGTPIYQRSYLEAVAATFAEHIRICVVYRGNRPVAASFQAYEGGVAEGLWLGTRAADRRQHAGYVLYWELLKDAAEHGCTHFHLGRSTADSGAEAFKKKWNARASPLYWQYILRTRRTIPQINTGNPRYRLAISAWRRLPVSLTTKVGPLLARNIP